MLTPTKGEKTRPPPTPFFSQLLRGPAVELRGPGPLATPRNSSTACANDDTSNLWERPKFDPQKIQTPKFVQIGLREASEQIVK